MPTPLFFELNVEKQQKIITAGISEFAGYGYENSSTNRIVKKAGISKGSLFKYFPAKEDFYFYVLNEVTSELIFALEKDVNTLSTDLFQRIEEYAVLEFSWHIMYPEKSRMIVRAFSKNDPALYKKTILKYGDREQELYYRFMQDVDTSCFRWDRQKTIDLIKWFLKGFNEDFLEQIQKQQNTDLEKAKKDYVKNLSEYMKILKEGILQ